MRWPYQSKGVTVSGDTGANPAGTTWPRQNRTLNIRLCYLHDDSAKNRLSDLTQIYARTMPSGASCEGAVKLILYQENDI